MTEQHVPVERLAAYAAGDLDASAALEVETHVLLCADCRADAEAVQRATGDLAALPQVTMPADVAARVDAALAAERTSAAAPDAERGPVGDVLPMAPARRRNTPSWAGMAAAAAGLALVAAISVPFLNGGAADRSNTEASGAGGGPVQTRRLESGLEYTADNPEAALERALRGATGDPQRRAHVPGAPAAADASTEASLDNATPAAVQPAPPEALTLTREYAKLTADAGRLAACIDALAASQPGGLGRTPLLVDFAVFEDEPSLIVVFPTVSRGQVRPDRVDFWAVGPRCGITPGDDDVRHFARFPRPSGL